MKKQFDEMLVCYRMWCSKFLTAKTQGIAYIARIRTKATHDNTQTWSRQTVIHTNLLVWVSGSQIKLHGFEFECVLNDFNSL